MANTFIDLEKLYQKFYSDRFASQIAFLVFVLKLIPGIGDKTVRNILDNVEINNNLKFIADNLNSFFPSSKFIIDQGGSVLNDDLESKLDYYTEDLKNQNILVFSYKDQCYPSSLFSLDDFPTLLFVKGNLEYDFDLSLSIVGTRKNSKYGEIYCRKFVKDLSSYFFTIVSGLAIGIDVIAHDEALKNGMKCIGVLGHGFDYIYPYVNKKYYENILCKGGFLLTEYYPDQKPDRVFFPRRNRIIAALSRGTLVVEASLDSGSMITADVAFDIDRQVFAIPGALDMPNSLGCNYLIKANKAKLVMSVSDILAEFNIPLRSSKRDDEFTNNRIDQILACLPRENTGDYRRIILVLNKKAITTEELIREINLELPTLLNLLSNLEVMGIVERGYDEKWYIK